MSRRSRHGRRPQASTTPPEPESEVVVDGPRAAIATAPPADRPVVEAGAAARATPPPVTAPAPIEPAAISAARSDSPNGRVVPAVRGDAEALAPGDGEALRTTCTQAQLRRFIKSRPWIPLHELRRRFGIYGGDDDVTPVRVGNGTIFLGLPGTESRMLGELISGGDVGYELSLDPGAPIVVGVYPMRPVPRG